MVGFERSCAMVGSEGGQSSRCQGLLRASGKLVGLPKFMSTWSL